MKQIAFFLFIISILCVNSFAQESLFTWPIPDKKAGENILYRPNDYIAGEENYANLIIAADENTPIVAPVTGVVTFFNYVYYKKYSGSIWFHLKPTPDYMSDCYEIVTNYPNDHYDPKYISIAMGIKMVDGSEIHISGMKPEKVFKTGAKITQGDIIGKVGYLYYKINKPCISFSISKNGKADDPMLPFGLKSTFKKFVKKEIISLKKEEALEDINVFIEAIEEGYPGLYDYLTSDEWEVLVINLKKQISEKIAYDDFYSLLKYSFVNRIKDNHFAVTTRLPMKQNESYSMPTITFGFLNDSLVITNAKLTHSEYYGKRILEVDGITVDTIKQCLFNKITDIDGFVQSDIDYNLLLWAWSGFNKITNNPKSEYLVKFDNDSIVFFSASESKNKQSCVPYKANWREFLLHNTDSLTLLKIEDSIGYIGIHSFYLTEIEMDKIAAFVKQLQDSACKHIIIDVRNNPGGDTKICAKLFSFFAQQPFITQEYSQVKKRNGFKFFRYCTNYNEDVSDLFMEYEPLDSKDGYFDMNIDTIYPDSEINFSGNLYVIANERSISAATLFAGLVHQYKRGIIVGRETGNTYHQMNALKFAQLQLPNSQIEITMPLVKCVFDTQERNIPYGRGVLPHFLVNFSLEELEWANGDTMLNFTLQLISNGKYLVKDEDVLKSKSIINFKIILWVVMIFGGCALFCLFYSKKRSRKQSC